jgi:DNA repair exonuclease SbcCD ATPase subunit
MRTLGALTVKNYAVYKKATLDLDFKGVTQILARNKDADQGAGSSNNTNAAGKSALTGALGELFWGYTPSGKDTASKKFRVKKSSVSVEVKNVGKDSVTETIEKSIGKTTAYQFYRNGKPFKTRGLRHSETRAQALLGMSETDFYTRVYLDSRIPHPLIVGKPSARQEFFVQMFGLENVDNARKLLTLEYRKAQQTQAAYRELRETFEELKRKRVDKDTLASKQEELDACLAKQTRLLKRFNSLQKTRDLYQFLCDNQTLVRRLNKVTKGDDARTVYKDLRRLKGKLLERKEELKEWEKFYVLRDEYRAKYRKSKAVLEDLLGKSWDTDRKATEKRVEAAKATKEQLREAKADLARLEVVEKPSEVDQPRHTLQECSASIHNLQNELEHTQQFHKGKCPTCGSSVKARPESEIRDELAKWKARKKRVTAYEDYTARQTAYKTYRKIKQRCEESIATLSKEFSKVEHYLQVGEALRSLPDLPAPPSPIEPKYTSDDIDTKLLKVERRLSVLEQALPVIDRLLDAQALSPEAIEEAKAFNSIADTLTEVNNKVSDLTAFVTSANEVNKQLKTLAGRGERMREEASSADILKDLIDIYSRTGIKKLLIEQYAARLQSQLNKFRQLLFVEDYTFELQYQGAGLQFLVHRKHGKKVTTTDVKKLSGAEYRMLTILLFVATITLLPANKRLNVMILDEPDANLGPGMITHFVNAIPILNKIVPHIVILTPNPDLVIPGARVFTVVKQNGVATLQKGRQ